MTDGRITPEALAEMRRVLSEHYWFDIEWDDILNVPDRLVIRSIERNYPQGLDGFFEDLATKPGDRRRIVVVDCETSGLRDFDIVVEVAWLDFETGESGVFVPQHDVAWVLAYGQPQALEINHYRERLKDAPQDEGDVQGRALMARLTDAVLAGSNARFDARHLALRYGGETCHHRLWELSSYAAPLMGLPGWALPGLDKVCARLGVVNTAPHTALGDVQATMRCLRILQGRVLSTPAAFPAPQENRPC